MRDDPEKPAVPVGSVLDSMVAQLQKMDEASRQLREQWREWAAETDRAIPCLDHPAEFRQIDPDNSMRQSRAGKMVAIYFKCPLCIEAERMAREAERLRKNGVPSDLLGATLDNWVPAPGNAEDARCLAECRRFVELRKGFLILLSPMKVFGNGKSHLTVATMRALGCRGEFITYADFVAQLREDYSRPSERRIDPVTRLSRRGFLGLDDIGISSGGRDELPAIHRVLDVRKADMLPTVITGNFASLSDMTPVLGERLIDRLKEVLVACVVLNSPSRRRARF